MARRPRLSAAERDALERQNCATCGTPASDAAGGRNGLVYDPDGTAYAQCTGCWNAGVAERDRQRRAELAARPDCEACRTRKQTHQLRPNPDVTVGLCGPCAKRARWNLRQPALYGTGWGHVTRDMVIRAAGRNT